LGRRRKKAVRILRRTLPELYLCPRCGKNTVKSTVYRKQRRAVVICSNCGLKQGFECTPNMAEVDAYCAFVDAYYSGEPLEEAAVD
jgi:transcription elongation factor Elf1